MLEGLWAPAVTLLVPSTIFIDSPEPGFSEYAAAKAAGEKVGQHESQRLRARGVDVTLLQPRLGRMHTDQTASASLEMAGDPVAALISLLGLGR